MAAVVPIFNGISHTLKFLKSMDEQDYPGLTVVVVDDGSTDGSAEKIASAFPNTVVLKGTGDLWWSGATNLGVQWALEQGFEYTLTINNDVRMAPGSIKSLVRVATAHPKTIVGSVVRYESDPAKIWFAGAFLNRKTGEMEHLTDEISGPTNTVWLTGMGILVPAEAYSKVGLYDARHFPQYFGDADFSLRAKEHGYRLLVDPESVLFADVASSWLKKQSVSPKNLGFLKALLFSRRSPYNVMTRYRFYRRHWGRGYVKPLWRIYTTIALKGLKKRAR